MSYEMPPALPRFAFWYSRSFVWRLLTEHFILGVPAKLPGFSGDPANGSSVVHHAQAGHLHHHHHHQAQQQQQQQQQQAGFSNGYHPHPHHLHHHAQQPLPPTHLRPNGSTFYGWPGHNNNSNNNNAQQPLHQQLPPPQVMAIVNK